MVSLIDGDNEVSCKTYWYAAFY